ncbi:MAG: hypothetical protein OQL28_05130, partial [Sedimenticola sp.]|nr:hypothetical protein [Sedimenticola sp.]
MKTSLRAATILACALSAPIVTAQEMDEPVGPMMGYPQGGPRMMGAPRMRGYQQGGPGMMGDPRMRGYQQG